MQTARKWVDNFVARKAVVGLDPNGRPDGNALFDDFVKRSQAFKAPRVLELGTKRWQAQVSTRHEAWIPHAGEYLGTDIESGLDVDIVADAHRLSQVIGVEQFDVIISCST